MSIERESVHTLDRSAESRLTIYFVSEFLASSTIRISMTNDYGHSSYHALFQAYTRMHTPRV